MESIDFGYNMSLAEEAGSPDVSRRGGTQFWSPEVHDMFLFMLHSQEVRWKLHCRLLGQCVLQGRNVVSACVQCLLTLGRMPSERFFDAAVRVKLE